MVLGEHIELGQQTWSLATHLSICKMTKPGRQFVEGLHIETSPDHIGANALAQLCPLEVEHESLHQTWKARFESLSPQPHR